MTATSALWRNGLQVVVLISALLPAAGDQSAVLALMSGAIKAASDDSITHGTLGAQCVLTLVGLNLTSLEEAYASTSKCSCSSAVGAAAALGLPPVVQYFKRLDVCAFFSDAVEHWGDGCGDVLAQMVQASPGVVCSVAADCRQRVAVPDGLHGLCYDKCQNTPDVNGTILTTCKLPLLARSGLTHPRLCGDKLPLDALLQYMGAWDMVVINAFSTVATLLNHVADQTALFEAPHPVDYVYAAYQSLIILHIIVYATYVLYDAGHSCRFFVLSTPFMFAPFSFAFFQLTQVFVTMAMSLRQRWNDASADEKKNRDNYVNAVLCRGKPSIKERVAFALFVFTPAMLAYVGTFMFLIPLSLTSFWALIAYPHITVILLLAYMILPSCVFLCATRMKHILRHWRLVFGSEAKKMAQDMTGATDSKDTAGRTLQTEEAHDEAVLEASTVTFSVIMVCAQLLIPLSMLLGAGFILYITGDWKALHTTFFDEIALPRLEWPNFQEDVQSTLRDLFAMKPTLNMSSVYVVSLLGQLVYLGVKSATTLLVILLKNEMGKALMSDHDFRLEVYTIATLSGEDKEKLEQAKKDKATWEQAKKDRMEAEARLKAEKRKAAAAKAKAKAGPPTLPKRDAGGQGDQGGAGTGHLPEAPGGEGGAVDA